MRYDLLLKLFIPLLVFAIWILFMPAIFVNAHAWKTDLGWCHTDEKTWAYHCHDWWAKYKDEITELKVETNDELCKRQYWLNAYNYSWDLCGCIPWFSFNESEKCIKDTQISSVQYTRSLRLVLKIIWFLWILWIGSILSCK